MSKVKFTPNIKMLISIGNDASRGKICNHCGRNFKKETGKPRTCIKCTKEIKDLWR